MANFNVGDVYYSGYPTSHVFNFSRNSKKQLKFSKQKHLLWGDWVKVTDYDYRTDPKNEIVTAAETTLVNTKLTEIAGEMVPVRVRGVSGYMDRADLDPDQLLEIIFLDVGQGDGALMITPDDKRFVIDAGQDDNVFRYLKWRFAGFKNEHTNFDGFIITHPDQDHYLGFSELIETDGVCATNVWHNGIVEQFKFSGGVQNTASEHLLGARQTTSGQSYLTGLIEDDATLLAHLAQPKRWIKDSTGKAKRYPEMLNKAQSAIHANGTRRFPNVSMLSTAHGEMHGGQSYLPGFGPDNADGCEIKIIGPLVEPAGGKNRLRTFGSKPMKKTTSMNSGKTKNGHSILLKMNYGNLRILFGGDLNSPAEMFLLGEYTGMDLFDLEPNDISEAVEAARPVFESDVAKSCHHGSADFTDSFMNSVGAAATVISSGDEESHAHPRSDTLGAIGLHGHGHRPLVFSTELSRSTKEFIKMEDTPWYQAGKLEGEIVNEPDPIKKADLQKRVDQLKEWTSISNVTSYGAINLRSDGDKVVLAYMLEKSSRSRRWDVYTLESTNNGRLRFKDVKKAEADEKARRAAIV